MFAPALALIAARPLVVAYVPNWKDDMASFVRTIDYAKLTHINVAFENPTNDEGDLSFNAANDVLIKAAHEHGVRILVSLGGGKPSGDPEAMKRTFYLLSPTRRAGFVRKLVDYVVEHDFDGLDVDLEGPSINGDYDPFVTALSIAMKAKGKLLTAALSQGYGGSQVPRQALDAFEFVNVMAYDGTGPWAPDRPGQHSSLEFARSNVKYWIDRGLPKSKIVLGVPFYGYGFGEASKGEEWSYRNILAAYPDADKADRVGNTVWYNGVATMRAKGRYIVDEGLAGAMIWSLDSDVSGEKSLLTALSEGLSRRVPQ